MNRLDYISICVLVCNLHDGLFGSVMVDNESVLITSVIQLGMTELAGARY